MFPPTPKEFTSNNCIGLVSEFDDGREPNWFVIKAAKAYDKNETKRIQLSQTGIALGPIKNPAKSSESTIIIAANEAAVLGLFADVLASKVIDSAACAVSVNMTTKVKNVDAWGSSPTIQYVMQLYRRTSTISKGSSVRLFAKKYALT
ncbi:hypothetical protein F1559_004786 [Cyanidiococcus yangmingshanensis]|uniref:Uncharacterized protein n=1 Tax=Cyanidiococcus yangmingshanensis TaxID=2690220 RepID=A0A7J7ILZ5_9RHOD|nr:hypothetical protein F1559_004786 [Cyanidiococcus yangmingshanensis]